RHPHLAAATLAPAPPRVLRHPRPHFRHSPSLLWIGEVGGRTPQQRRELESIACPAADTFC
ncbi:Protein of unknown function, partial [Gryllus bimaculatus]